MRSADAVEQLRSELGQDLYFIEINAAKNREMTERLARMASPDEFDYAALGYTLHNLYTAFESYFLRIAKFFENDIEEPGRHRSLLERMTLRIEGMRPSLFGLDFLPRLDELRRFRHAFAICTRLLSYRRKWPMPTSTLLGLRSISGRTTKRLTSSFDRSSKPFRTFDGLRRPTTHVIPGEVSRCARTNANASSTSAATSSNTS
jgi:hypothetical protein